mmetsp:Transcript_4780/g.14376  ORF Transcript_4780/g.14376 Transcript_4780/m.14376 type:complete len:82 (-) Transcript_4780:2157-2402(-)
MNHWGCHESATSAYSGPAGAAAVSVISMAAAGAELLGSTLLLVLTYAESTATPPSASGGRGVSAAVGGEIGASAGPAIMQS